MEDEVEDKLFVRHNYSKNEDITSYLKASNAKKLSLILVVAFSLFHGVRLLRFGTDSCNLVLKDGRYNGRAEWHPHGCMIHRFTQLDAKRCFKLLHFLGQDSSIVFVGDSSIQNLFVAFLREVNEDAPANRNVYTDTRLGLQIRYTKANYLSDIFSVTHWKVPASIESMIVVGFGVSHFKDIVLDRESFRYNLTKMLPALDRLTDYGSKIIWASVEPVSTKVNTGFNNSFVTNLNYDTVDLIKYSKARMYEVNYKLSYPYVKDMTTDGISLPWNHVAKKSGAQILLNVFCNYHMNFNDGNCCGSAEPTTLLQIITLSSLFICFLSAIIVFIYSAVSKGQIPFISGGVKMPRVLSSLGKLSLILAYIFICDRTNFFLKESKYYSRSTFWIPVSYVFIIGLFFTDVSRHTKVLHRDQTDEWKGWMQVVILIYNWTDSMQVLPLYMGIRVLNSAYLFLSGYGHFTYYWHTADFSITRLLQVLFRLNLFTVLLCLVMNRPYQFYSFVPLATFWYTVLYVFFIVPPRVTSNLCEINPLQYLYLVLKFVGLFGIITTLYMSEVFFSKIFVTRPWKALFVSTDDDIHGWWQRWSRDRYTLPLGMLFAAGLAVAKRHSLITDDNHRGNLLSNSLSLAMTLVALVSVASYAGFTFVCRDRDECLEIHAYAVAVPIVGYLILKNLSGVLRTRYSTFFAWFGRISLELYVAQAHIWLAGDSHGVLVFLPEYSHLNAFITSFIFICVSQEMHSITNTLLPYAVPADKVSIGRNLILFLALLVPIGVQNGMF